MMPEQCPEPISPLDLADYWSGNLASQAEERVEEHLLGCDFCAGELERIIGIGMGIRELVRDGRVEMVLSRELLEKLRAAGVRVREYAVAAGGHVQCTATADDDVVLARLSAELAGSPRIDLLQMDAAGEVAARWENVPFHGGRNEILFTPVTALLKTVKTATMRVHLVSVAGGRDSLLAEYTFHHTTGH